MAKAKLLRRRKWTDEGGNLYEMAIWQIERSLRYPEGVRYRLAFVRRGEATPALLYDNHHPKGHHRHFQGRQEEYGFTTVEQLIIDFISGTRVLAGEDK